MRDGSAGANFLPALVTISGIAFRTCTVFVLFFTSIFIWQIAPRQVIGFDGETTVNLYIAL